MGRRTSVRRKAVAQAAAFNQGRDILYRREIPTRDQQKTPPPEAYVVVNLLLAVVGVMIGGALWSLRY